MRGGALCLDFANTAGWRPAPGDEEWIRDYEDLALWARRVDAVGAGELRELLRQASDDPRRAGTVHRKAVALREALYRIFSAAALSGLPNSSDVDLLNAVVRDAFRHLRLAPADGGFAWQWEDARPALELPLWRVARSAADLLASSDLARVHECAGDNCDWLFLDASRNRSRRWCDMAACGNRAKARRNYARRKQGRTQVRSERSRKA